MDQSELSTKLKYWVLTFLSWISEFLEWICLYDKYYSVVPFSEKNILKRSVADQERDVSFIGRGRWTAGESFFIKAILKILIYWLRSINFCKLHCLNEGFSPILLCAVGKNFDRPFLHTERAGKYSFRWLWT